MTFVGPRHFGLDGPPPPLKKIKNGNLQQHGYKDKYIHIHLIFLELKVHLPHEFEIS